VRVRELRYDRFTEVCKTKLEKNPVFQSSELKKRQSKILEQR
jgi:hypothetical protein